MVHVRLSHVHCFGSRHSYLLRNAKCRERENQTENDLHDRRSAVLLEDRNLDQEAQQRGYWVDPSTLLMWAGKDNGKDVSWRKARNYCHNLRLATYSDWRLPTLAELLGIYKRSADTPGLAGPGKGIPFTWRVNGNLLLTGDQWRNNQRADDRGRPSGYVWHFDFNEGRSFNQPTGFPYPFNGMRALCVRRAGE